MTHKERIVEILDEAGIDYGHTGGDSIIANGCRFRFFVNGLLREVESEGGGDYGDDY